MFKSCVRAAAILSCSCWCAGATFTPLAKNGEDQEAMPGIWLRPDLGSAAQVVPLKTRLWATKESVTGGMALKVVLAPGSTGIIAMEHDAYPAGSAGITFYAKASLPVVVVAKGTEKSVGTAWSKIDFSWAELGTTSSSPNVDWQFVLSVKGPITTETAVILDRMGVESPVFDAAPALSPTSGPDSVFDGDTMLYGASNLAPTVARLAAKQPFTIIGFGDSVTAGVQAYRSTWTMSQADCAPYLYFSHLARLLNARSGYAGVSWLQSGHGGWTTAMGLTVVDSEVVAPATSSDLVIIEYGGNDLAAGHTIAQLKADLKQVIARVKTKTSQIILMPATLSQYVFGYESALNAMVQEIVAEDSVAGADLVKFMEGRGISFGWAMEANQAHPDMMGHITIAEMIAPLLTGEHMVYPSNGTPVASTTGTTGSTGTGSTSATGSTSGTSSTSGTTSGSSGSSSTGTATGSGPGSAGSTVDSGGSSTSTCGLGGGLAIVAALLVIPLRRRAPRAQPRV
ncbi:MAG: SGNH/GDSL hydrolase family protein [Planctomycetes bacterium]|nr:SGNH/GDSL hydrolase family protein [Planctomycetota bacterium]